MVIAMITRKFKHKFICLITFLILLILPFSGHCQKQFKFKQKQFEHDTINQIILEESKESSELKIHALAIPQKLINMGIKKIDQFNVEKLKNDIGATTFKENNSFVYTLAPDTLRYSGMYTSQKRTAVLNSTVAPIIYPSSNNPVEERLSIEVLAEPLLLHEAMGANKIDDRNYEKSLALYFLTLPEESDRKLSPDDVFKSLRPIMSEGGVTIVGGGGDFVAINIKRLLIELALSKKSASKLLACENRDPAQLFVKLLKLKIEYGKNRISYGSFASLDYRLIFMKNDFINFDRFAWTFAIRNPNPFSNAALVSAVNDFCRLM